MDDGEPEIITCEHCDAEIIAEEAVVTSKGELWCQTCDDNFGLLEEEKEDEKE